MYFEVYSNLQKQAFWQVWGLGMSFQGSELLPAPLFLVFNVSGFSMLLPYFSFILVFLFFFFLTVHFGSPWTKFHDQELEHSNVFLFLLFCDVHVTVKLTLHEDVVLNSFAETRL